MRATCRITPLKACDITSVAQLHEKAFPDLFLSSLGAEFLSEFCRGFPDGLGAVGLVGRHADAQFLGAVVGTFEPEGFFGRPVRRRLLTFALVSARAPHVAPQLLRGLRYRGDAPSEAAGVFLRSICVDPSVRGWGLGSTLLNQLIHETTARGGQRAYLTTAANNSKAINRYYGVAGWDLDNQFVTREGWTMNRYSTAVLG